MDGGYSYEFYDSLSFYLPLSFMILGMVSMILIPIIVLWCRYKYGREAVNTIYSLQFELLRLVYGSSLKRVETSDDGIVFTLHDKRLTVFKMVSLFAVFVIIYSCVMVAFFSDLFVSESTGVCNIHMDCFAFNTSTGTLVQQEALQGNCSDIQDDPSYLIRCYKLSFNYATALGNAGGVLVFGYFIMTYQTPFLEASTYIGASKKISLCLLISYIFLFVIVGGGVFSLLVRYVPEFRASIFATRKTILQFLAYSVTFEFSLWASFIVVTSLAKQENVKEAKEGDDTNVKNRDKNIMITKM